MARKKKTAAAAKSPRFNAEVVALNYLINGIECLSNYNLSRLGWKKVLAFVEEKGSEAKFKALAAYVTNLGFTYDATRGRTPPTEGETRTYKAQVIKDGSPFIRLPVSLFDIDAGAEVVASFSSKGISVSAA